MRYFIAGAISFIALVVVLQAGAGPTTSAQEPTVEVAPEETPAAPLPYWQRRGCEKGYRSSTSYRRLKSLLRHHRPLERGYKRKVSRLTKCVTTFEKARALRSYVDRSRKWRTQYQHIWPIRRAEIAGSVAAIRYVLLCESGGRYWIHNDPYSGGYQYLDGTWARAQSYYSQVTGKLVVGWTGSAYLASPAHQDVVTAVFFAAHSGEWACA